MNPVLQDAEVEGESQRRMNPAESSKPAKSGRLDARDGRMEKAVLDARMGRGQNALIESSPS